ncbi:MAG: MlaC/ttg2D family ABC transporter substrate-binding protein [Chromatiales bacterium]
MKAWLRVMGLMTGLLFTAGVAAVPSPEQVIRDTTDRVLARVRAERAALQADTRKLYGLVDEVIIPHFDFEGASRLVLGRHWRTADEATRARFTEAFRELLVRTYANALLQYVDETVVFKSSQADGKSVVVRTEIAKPGAHPIPVNYRMHMKNGEWKCYDVFVDGISLIVTYRESFASQISQSGLASLIGQMEAKNEGLR